MFVGESKNCKPIQTLTELNLYGIHLGNLKLNREQLNVTIIKQENWTSFWKCFAL